MTVEPQPNLCVLPPFFAESGIIVLSILAAPLAMLGLWQIFGVCGSLIAIRRLEAPHSGPSSLSQSRVAILYPTCNDFSEAAVESLLTQTGVTASLFLLDDSSDPGFRAKVDSWARGKSAEVRVIRRPNREGYKAGNLNHWLMREGSRGEFPFVLLVDADEVIPPDFSQRLLDALEAGGAAFAQGCHEARAPETPFQRLLHLQVATNWRFGVPARALTGLPWMLGHGVMLRTSDLLAVGGFPQIVSEDLALTIALAEKERFGIPVPNALGQEEFPRNCAAYWRRLSRWITADTELCLKLLPRLWQSRIPLRAKVDLTLRELRLPLLALGWIGLALLSTLILLDSTPSAPMTIVAWLIPAALCLPHLAVWLLPGKRIGRKAIHSIAMPFQGMAALGLYPPAVWKGMRGRGSFHPTGGTGNRKGSPGLAIWQAVSGLIFGLAGLLGTNLPLAATGLAIGMAPLLRVANGALLHSGGTLAFWGLIAGQVVIDAQIGHTNVAYLLPLAALGAVTD